MGFVPKRTIYKLVDWPDPEMRGLEVRFRALNTGQVFDLDEKKEAAQRELADGDKDEDGEAGKAVIELFQLMADQMIEWNVTEEDGTPVPPTMDGIRQQELPFNMAIIDAWQTAVSDVPAPLEHGSPSGDPSLEASIPMEPLSPSPESSAVPA